MYVVCFFCILSLVFLHFNCFCKATLVQALLSSSLLFLLLLLYCREIAVMTTWVEKGATIGEILIFLFIAKKNERAIFHFYAHNLLLFIFFFCMVLTCPVPKQRQTARGLDDLVVPDRFIPQRQSLNQRALARLPDLQLSAIYNRPTPYSTC